MLSKIKFGLWLAFFAVVFIACEPDDLSESDDVRDRFVGNWSCTEVSSINGQRSFSVAIAIDSSTTNGIVFYNLYRLGNTVETDATVSTVEEQTVTIISQFVDDFYVSGSGVLETNDRINLTYVVDDGVEVDSLTAVLTKF